MKSKLLVAILIVALVVAGAMVVAAGRGANAPAPGPGKGGPGPGMGMGAGCPMGLGPMVARDLNLTQAQINELQALRQEFADTTKPIRDQIQAKMKDMVSLWTAPTPNATQIKNLAADIDALRAQIRDTGIDYMIRGLNVLTPEQREKLRTRVQTMADKCIQAGGCGMGCGFGMGAGCGMGLGPGAGMGRGAACPMGRGAGMGPGRGFGMGNGTGPRAQMGTCPKIAQ